MQSTLFHRAAVGLTSLMISGMAVASDWTERSNENLRPGVTGVSQEVYDLHTTILWIVTIIGLLVFGLIGYVLMLLRFSPAPLLLGYVLGPMMEENFRRALLIGRGDPMVLIDRPISGAILGVTGLLLLYTLGRTLFAMRRRARERNGESDLAHQLEEHPGPL